MLGANVGIAEPHQVIELQNRVNDLGLDVSSTDTYIAWAIEAYQRGFLDREAVGYELRFGDYQTIGRLIEDVAARRGFGDLLAEGSAFVEGFPREAQDFLMAIKGLPQSDPHDVRYMKGFALGIVTASRGADHDWPGDGRPPYRPGAVRTNAGRVLRDTWLGRGRTAAAGAPGRTGGAAVSRRIYANPDLCTGCEMCSVACSVVKLGVANPHKGAVVIRRNLFERYEFQTLCRQCDPAPCMDACMTGCITRDLATGTVVLDSGRCVGCWMCAMVCPYDASSAI